jgi:hypothetical protein
MGRVAATAVHLTLSAIAAALYVLFVIPRWWELMGETSHTLGTVMRILAGALTALAALPVLLNLQRNRESERNIPPLALKLELRAAVALLLAGVLVIGAAVAEIWLSTDKAGPLLFGIYGGAAALAILGILGFQLTFVAALPPAPAKPKKGKKSKTEPAEEASESNEETAEEGSEAVEVPAVDSAAQATKVSLKKAGDGSSGEPDPASEADAEAGSDPVVEPVQKTPEAADEPSGVLRNKRPSGKSGHRLRRRELGSTAVEATPLEEAARTE